MSILCWNCWGLRNQQTENQLADMVWAKDPSVVFLAETWIDEARLMFVKEHLKMKNKFMAPRRNKTRCLMIFWKEDFDLTVETFSKYHIDSTINKNKEGKWRFTRFYGEPDTQKRHDAWGRLRSLKARGKVSNQKKLGAEHDLMDKCKGLEMYWMNADLWTWVLWDLCSLGISTLKLTQYGRG